MQQELAHLEESLKRRTIEVECGPLSVGDTEPWRSSIERLKQRFRVPHAADLHPDLVFADKAQSWPSPSSGVVTPDVLDKLQGARAILIAMGFRVDADPKNDLSDGKSWTLICEWTDNVPSVPDPADLVEERLRSEGLPVATKPFWDEGKLLVDLWDSQQVSAQPTRAGRTDEKAHTVMPTTASPAPEFTHSADYRSITWKNERYSLTGQQAAIVKVMYETWERGNPELGDGSILEDAGCTKTSRLRDTFRNSPLWGTLIVEGKTKGSHRLNL
jgi:hypothetical protein